MNKKQRETIDYYALNVEENLSELRYQYEDIIDELETELANKEDEITDLLEKINDLERRLESEAA